MQFFLAQVEQGKETICGRLRLNKKAFALEIIGRPGWNGRGAQI